MTHSSVWFPANLCRDGANFDLVALTALKRPVLSRKRHVKSAPSAIRVWLRGAKNAPKNRKTAASLDAATGVRA